MTLSIYTEYWQKRSSNPIKDYWDDVCNLSRERENGDIVELVYTTDAFMFKMRKLYCSCG